jgi:hypothetical protein
MSVLRRCIDGSNFTVQCSELSCRDGRSAANFVSMLGRAAQARRVDICGNGVRK